MELVNDLINLTTTENNALAFKSTLNASLDFFFLAVPGIDERRLRVLFEKSWAEDPLLALKLLFGLRSVREGKSDKRNFYVAIQWLMKCHPKTFLANLNVVPETGYWKDLMEVLRWNMKDTMKLNEKQEKEETKAYLKRIRLLKETQDDTFKEALDKVASLFAEKLKLDLEIVKQGNSPSLAAKWVPTQGGSHDKYLGLNKKIALLVFPSNDHSPEYIIQAKHRLQKEVLAPIRAAIPVTEVKMASNNWDSINYESVPSVCMNKNSKVFQKHDQVRFEEYLNNVKTGKSKINATALLPHEICKSALGEAGEVAELQWIEYVNKLQKIGSFDHLLAVCDVSGSMGGIPMEVSIAMGILTASLVTEPFRNLVCTFSENPEFFKVPEGSLKEKYEALSRMQWGMSTNFKGVFDLILSRALATNTSADNMIKTVIVFSDMQFNEAGNYSNTIHQQIQQDYAQAGYTPPKIIYWNLRASEGGLPVTTHDSGALLLSGYSGTLLKHLMNGEQVSAVELMMETLKAPFFEKLVVVD